MRVDIINKNNAFVYKEVKGERTDDCGALDDDLEKSCEDSINFDDEKEEIVENGDDKDDEDGEIDKDSDDGQIDKDSDDGEIDKDSDDGEIDEDSDDGEIDEDSDDEMECKYLSIRTKNNELQKLHWESKQAL
eukprot:gene7219-12902_t